MTDVSGRLTAVTAGQRIVYGGDRFSTVSAELADAFREGDQLVVDPSSGALLHIPADDLRTARDAVGRAADAFALLGGCDDAHVTRFFEEFAGRLADDTVFAPIAAANRDDVVRAEARGRSTTRLELTAEMRSDMVRGLRGWATTVGERDAVVQTVEHDGWAVEARRAPLGVIGFVFEGRPNVFADAAGVVRTGNTVVFRIGSDALATATAIVEHALDPALSAAGLPAGTVSLVQSSAHAAGWALFTDQRLALAVARGSGPTVSQLGSVARAAGIPTSLHGTGGAWLVAAADAEPTRFRRSVTHSLDRKVCNTLNVCCVERARAPELVPVFVEAVMAAAERRGVDARIHATPPAYDFVPTVYLELTSKVERADGVHDEPLVTPIDAADLGREWEWERSPEVSVHVVDDVAAAAALFNSLSPRFVATLISESAAEHRAFWTSVDAPFVGDGMTRWVDGQYALDTPELGLSNWESGRMLGRGGILSGDSIYTIRYRASVTDTDLRR